ncbi:MAG TPA: sulfotransferase [Steroidobacteraceae bacterium]|nr:sulfotransferase [Steroidobacteraceae bacterium]
MSASNPSSTASAETRRRAQAALRAGQAATAELWLRSLEAKAPGDAECLWLLGAALLAQDRIPESLETLERSLVARPDSDDSRVDLARACRRAGQPERARAEVERVLKTSPNHHRAWLACGDALVDLGELADARTAFDRARLTDPARRQVEEATAALAAGDRRRAETIFRDILVADASHVAALCGLASLSLDADVPGDAERLLRHALQQSAHIPSAWRGLAPALIALGRLEEADAAARHAAQIEPENPQTWITIATVATRLMRPEEALEAYERAALLTPREVRLRLTIGHVNKTLGRRADSEAAYHAALAMDPGVAEGWWSLADLKNYSFTEAEVAAMQAALATDRRSRTNEAQLHFALGKAFEQRGRYAEAFPHYAQGNALRRLDAPFDIARFERRCERIRAFFDREFFAARGGAGNLSRAPIFIVGLPRSGSTLLEQILASHSLVEGTMELPNILIVTRELDAMAPGRDGYPETLRQVSGARLTALGARYLEQVAPVRSGRPHFTDKLPNNFSHVGLIHAMLPNATIVDARRHPMDACFSTFKQYFAVGQTFSYGLEDLGRYYRCYLSLMDHWDAVLPGKVLHLQYEELVRDREAGIRRLLEHCRLAFEPACLAFHETRRAVRTASAEQVRQPLYASAVGHWQHFATELEPLRRALGNALE